MWYSITALLLIVVIVNVKFSSEDDDEQDMILAESLKFKKFIREEYEQIMTYLMKEMESYRWNNDYESYFKTLKKVGKQKKNQNKTILFLF